MRNSKFLDTLFDQITNFLFRSNKKKTLEEISIDDQNLFKYPNTG